MRQEDDHEGGAEIDAALADPARLHALEETGMLSSPPSEHLERIARLTSRLLRAPIALVTLLGDREEYIVAGTGLDLDGGRTPAEHALCQHVVARGVPMHVADISSSTLRGARETLALGIGAYLGVPLSSGGHVIGSLCVLDHLPHAWLPADEQALQDFAGLVCDEFELRRTTAEKERLTEALHNEMRRDPLTGLYNRRFWNERAPVELSRARRDGTPLTAMMIDLDGFKLVNDRLGHAAGDDILETLGDAWTPLVRLPDILVRWGGDEFALLLPHAGEEEAIVIGERLRASVADVVGLTIGVAQWDGAESEDDLLRRADAALYEAKGRPARDPG